MSYPASFLVLLDAVSQVAFATTKFDKATILDTDPFHTWATNYSPMVNNVC